MKNHLKSNHKGFMSKQDKQAHKEARKNRKNSRGARWLGCVSQHKNDNLWHDHENWEQ